MRSEDPEIDSGASVFPDGGRRESADDGLSKVLIIDDEPVLRATIRHALEEKGLAVWVAANGREGIETCRRVRPHVVITDLVMPELDGLGAIEILRQDFPSLPIIAMSGADSAEERNRSLKVGALRFVTKPVAAATILELITDLLRLETSPQTAL